MFPDLVGLACFCSVKTCYTMLELKQNLLFVMLDYVEVILPFPICFFSSSFLLGFGLNLLFILRTCFYTT